MRLWQRQLAIYFLGFLCFFGVFGFIGGVPFSVVAVVWLILVDAARRVSEAIPGKPANQIISIVDGVSRKLLDFVAGRYGFDGDAALVKRPAERSEE